MTFERKISVGDLIQAALILVAIVTAFVIIQQKQDYADARIQEIRKRQDALEADIRQIDIRTNRDNVTLTDIRSQIIDLRDEIRSIAKTR